MWQEAPSVTKHAHILFYLTKIICHYVYLKNPRLQSYSIDLLRNSV